MGLEELFCFALFSYGILLSVLSGQYRRVDTLLCAAGVSPRRTVCAAASPPSQAVSSGLAAQVLPGNPEPQHL